MNKGHITWRKGLLLLNIAVMIAMVVHVGIRIYLHSQHPEYSAPAYTELVVGLCYLIPLVLFDGIAFIVRLFLRGK